MEKTQTIFLIIILLSILTSIYAKYFEKKKLYFIVKPLTMLFIIALPLLEMRSDYTSYAYLIMMGLVISMLGDLFLLYPDKYFTNGLYSFFMAHVLYIFAFNQNIGEYCFAIIIAIIVFILVVAKFLIPKLGGLKYPVLGYILIVSAMLFSALNMDIQFGVISFVGIGAILFTVSDTVLAFNKFYKKFSLAEPIILSTYFVAQLLFALSI